MTDRHQTETIPGLHHVTSIARDPKSNLSFYRDVLGLRFLKKTVNFDDPTTYHLYYGDEEGSPGTALTFFPFENARKGRVGPGQVNLVSFVIPEGTIDWWLERFETYGIDHEEPNERFGQPFIRFRDTDGHPMELISGSSSIQPNPRGEVPIEYGIRGFDSVTLGSIRPDETKELLELLGYEATGSDAGRVRFQSHVDNARHLEVLDQPGDKRARPGAGTVHHIAFRTRDSETQLAWRERLLDRGFNVTEQKDRFYFKSIYFREPGGILIELATDGPGFTADEELDKLGSSLKLPPWLENNRADIEDELVEL